MAQRIFAAKKNRRQLLTRLPIEEKVKILLRLQELAFPIYQARGLIREPWKIVLS